MKYGTHNHGVPPNHDPRHNLLAQAWSECDPDELQSCSKSHMFDQGYLNKIVVGEKHWECYYQSP